MKIIKSKVCFYSSVIVFVYFSGFSQNFNEGNDVDSIYNIGIEFFKNNELEKAEKKFKEILEIKTTNEKGLYGLLLVYGFQKKYDQIIKEFEQHEEVFSHKQTKVRYYFNLAVAYFKQNQPRKGYNAIGKYYDLVDAETLNNSDFLIISEIFYDYEEYESALKRLNRFFEVEESAKFDPDIVFIEFKLLHKLKQHDKALERVNDLLTELKPEDQVDFLLSIVDYTTSDESAEGAKPYLEKILSES